MLERLQVKDFQAHEQLRLRFDPGVTTIVGASDAGKSAVIRAIWWAMANQPGGDQFIRHGADEAVVWLWLDGRKIVRTRGKENLYHLDEQEYKAFGAGVPDPIAAVANVTSVNLQGQHDAAYWFHDTAGQVSRNLNSVVDLTIIDDVLGMAAGRAKHAKTKVEVCEEQYGKAQIAASGLTFVEPMAADYTKLQKLHLEARQAAHDSELLRTLLTAAKAASSEYRRATAYADAVAVVATLCGDAGRAAHRAAKLHVLIQGIKKIDALKPVPSLFAVGVALLAAQRAADKSNTLGQLIRQYKAIKVHNVPEFGKVDAAYVAHAAAKKKSDRLAYLLEELTAAQATWNLAKQKAAKAQAALDKAQEGNCPTCDQPFQHCTDQ